mmetsp:Transcript_54943/g.128498  ORF Transcript_54943/g.128498 Transcript_54943/m.128498 type:complete len:213 (-) Transcript_54943:1201-1839(-)
MERTGRVAVVRLAVNQGESRENEGAGGSWGPRGHHVSPSSRDGSRAGRSRKPAAAYARVRWNKTAYRRAHEADLPPLAGAARRAGGSASAGEEAGVLRGVPTRARQDSAASLGRGFARHVPLRRAQDAAREQPPPPRPLRLLCWLHRRRSCWRPHVGGADGAVHAGEPRPHLLPPCRLPPPQGAASADAGPSDGGQSAPKGPPDKPGRPYVL